MNINLTSNNITIENLILRGNKNSYLLVEEGNINKFSSYRFYDVSDYIRINYSEILSEGFDKKGIHNSEKNKREYVNNNINNILKELDKIIYLDYFVGIYKLKKNTEKSDIELIISEIKIIKFRGKELEIPIKFENAYFRKEITLENKGFYQRYIELDGEDIVKEIKKTEEIDLKLKFKTMEKLNNVYNKIDFGLEKSIKKQVREISIINKNESLFDINKGLNNFVQITEKKNRPLIKFNKKEDLSKYIINEEKRTGKKFEIESLKTSLSTYLLWNNINRDKNKISKSIIENSSELRFKNMESFFKYIVYDKFINESIFLDKIVYDNFLENISLKMSNFKGEIYQLNEKELVKNRDKAENIDFLMISIIINGLFENDLDEFIEKFNLKNIFDNIFEIKSRIEDGSNIINLLDINQEKTIEIINNKMEEFLMVWIPSFIKIKEMIENYEYFRELSTKDKLIEFIKIAKDYKKRTNVFKMLIKLGIYLKGKSSSFEKNIYSTLGSSIKYIALNLIIYAFYIVEELIDGKNDIKDLIPFLSLLNRNEIRIYNPLLKILETSELNKEWGIEIKECIEKIESGKVFSFDDENKEDLLNNTLNIKCSLENFEEIYLEKKLKSFFVYSNNNNEIEEENIKIEEKNLIIKNIIENETLIQNNRNCFEELDVLKNIRKELSDNKLISQESINDYTDKMQINSKYFISGDSDGQLIIYTDEISDLNKVIKDLKENHIRFYNQIFIKQFESIPEEQIYDGKIYNFDTSINYVRIYIKTKEEEAYIMLRLDKYSIDSINKLQIYKDRKFSSYKDIFSYTNNQYYADKGLVGSIINEEDYDYFLSKSIDFDDDIIEEQTNNTVIKIIENTQYGYVSINGEMDDGEKADFLEIYEVNDTKIEPKMKDLNGQEILTYNSIVLGKNLEFYSKDKKWFWESSQEYNFEIYIDNDDFYYFYNEKYKFIKIKKDEETILIIENFNKGDYGIFEKSNKIDIKFINKEKMDIPSYNFFIKYNEKYGLIASSIPPYYYVNELLRRSRKVCIGELGYRLFISERNRINKITNINQMKAFVKVHIQTKAIFEEVIKGYDKEMYESENNYEWTMTGNQEKLLVEANQLGMNNLKLYLKTYLSQIKESKLYVKELEKEREQQKRKLKA